MLIPGVAWPGKPAAAAVRAAWAGVRPAKPGCMKWGNMLTAPPVPRICERRVSWSFGSSEFSRP